MQIFTNFPDQNCICAKYWTISIGNHTHSSPIWEIIVLAIFKIVRGEGIDITRSESQFRSKQ